DVDRAEVGVSARCICRFGPFRPLIISAGQAHSQEIIVTSPSLSASEARELASEAYTYGFAIVENYRAMFGMSVWRDSPQYSGFNDYRHGRTLFDSSYDTVVNANNGTLYSTTFADLRAEPIVISVPPTADRYFVIQLVDMATDNFAYIGTRATGREGGDFVLV